MELLICITRFYEAFGVYKRKMISELGKEEEKKGVRVSQK